MFQLNYLIVGSINLSKLHIQLNNINAKKNEETEMLKDKVNEVVNEVKLHPQPRYYYFFSFFI